MKIRTCPRCRQHMLISTGAFWTCYACCYAITGQALIVDLAAEEGAGSKQIKGRQAQ